MELKVFEGRRKVTRYHLFTTILTILAAGGAPAEAAGLTISPTQATILPGQTQQFTARGAAGCTMIWTVDGVLGGNTTIGAVSQTGLYTASSSAARPQSVAVLARCGTLVGSSAVTLWGAQPPATNNAAGGLVSYPTPAIGANLALNPGLESVNAATHKPVSWSDNGFTLDTTVSHSGSASFKVTDPYAISYSQYGWQDISLKKGVYRIAGWIKTAGLGATKPGSVRICLITPAGGGGTSVGSGCTKLINGDTDWTRYEATRIVIAQDVTARLELATYGEPDGAAWFDDIELRREQQTLSVFMRYPNYRGILFDDQSQTAQFHVDVNPPDSTAATAYALEATVTQETTGSVLLMQKIPASGSLDVALDLSRVPRTLPYQISFKLVNPYTGAVEQYPAYRVVRQPASSRAAMTIAVDQQNRFLLSGKPSFLLGVYDSGMGYTTVAQSWQDTFTAQRRLFELPINLYLNYWYGGAPNTAMASMMNVLRQYGIYTLTNANCSATTPAPQTGNLWFEQSSDAVVADRGAHPGFGGYYAADECANGLADETLADAQRMRSLQNGGIVFGTQLPWTNDLPFWRDALDVIATDPYVIRGALPSTGYYPLDAVSDATKRTRDAVLGSRPFMTTIQFYKATLASPWPTQDELRKMSYAAIVEGSNGLFYWSQGAGALAYVCSTWCAERSGYFDALKAVMTELRSVEPVLTLPDQPAALTGNSNAAVHVRMKQQGSQRYLIVFNTAGTPQSVTFSFASPVQAVSVYGTAARPAVSSAGFSDTLAGFEPKIYSIQ
jgi:hypothetical protein